MLRTMRLFLRLNISDQLFLLAYLGVMGKRPEGEVKAAQRYHNSAMDSEPLYPCP